MLDLPNDKAKILGEWVNFNSTSVGHYALDILPKGELSVEDCLFGLSEDSKERMAALEYKYILHMIDGFTRMTECLYERQEG